MRLVILIMHIQPERDMYIIKDAAASHAILRRNNTGYESQNILN